MSQNLHRWIPSQLGHGEAMCARCHITNREAAVLGRLNACSQAANDLTSHEHLVLRALSGEFEVALAAWVTAAFEHLAAVGMCTNEPPYIITDAGREALAAAKASGRVVLDA
ncbi:hypothetical protein [Zavarzinia sp. CC-PAN008]|uniref:hypothetical protein n=1 Tax=Zavarzinia sp. CC-PAN008 TaxID=3243332 RepID=UPI003F74674F